MIEAIHDGPTEATMLALSATAQIDLEARRGPEDGPAPLPRFHLTAYTGAPMRIAGWRYPVVVDLDGTEITAQQRPVRFNHDASAGVGHTERIAIEEGHLVASGVISRDTAQAREVVTAARNGFPWQCSIGASVGEHEFIAEGQTVTVNGREWHGPVNIARRTTLGEISFVDAGADPHTMATIAAIETPADEPDPEAGGLTREVVVSRHRARTQRRDTIAALMAEALDEPGADVTAIEELAGQAENQNWNIDHFENRLLRLRRPAAPTHRGPVPLGGRVIEAALCLAGGLHEPERWFDVPTLEAAHGRFPHGISLGEVFLMAARDRGYTGLSGRDLRPILEHAFRPDIRGTGGGGFSTFSLSGILANTANKFLVRGFSAVESTWRAIARIRSVRDLKAVTSYSLSGGFIYEKLGPAGEIKHGDVGETTYTIKADTYARMFAITRTDLINDDLNALSEVPARLGRGAALKLNDVFWAAFMDNATFFTTARGNYITGADTALTPDAAGINALSLAEQKFLSQTDPDGLPVAITPAILLVPNTLWSIAMNLMSSQTVTGGTSSALANNPYANRYRVVASTYLTNTSYTGNSATAWYLLADPGELSVIDVAFLNGREEPFVESADADFNTLGVQMRGYHDFGVAKQEYRAGVKAKGAA
jgi:phage major head subunit gpT-like protein